LKYETMQTFSQLVILIGAVLAVFGTFGSYYFGKKAKPPPLTRAHVDEAVAHQLEQLYARLRSAETQVNEKYPGFSIHMVVALYKLDEKRRKYTLDLPGDKRGRLSIYHDPFDVFALSITDVYGEIHSLRVPSGPSGVPFYELIYLACEVGVRHNSTFLRVVVNGRQVGVIDFPFKIETGTIDVVGGVLGADLNGENGARFDMYEVVAYTSTLTTSETQRLLTYFSKHRPQQFVSFDKHQWTRFRGPKEGLRQILPEAKPRLKKNQRVAGEIGDGSHKVLYLQKVTGRFSR
jgi:hypothetical protein